MRTMWGTENVLQRVINLSEPYFSSNQYFPKKLPTPLTNEDFVKLVSAERI